MLISTVRPQQRSPRSLAGFQLETALSGRLSILGRHPLVDMRHPRCPKLSAHNLAGRLEVGGADKPHPLSVRHLNIIIHQVVSPPVRGFTKLYGDPSSGSGGLPGQDDQEKPSILTQDGVVR